MKTGRFGFTLLELMIGLVIVAILASIAIPSFSKAIEKTKIKDAQTTLSAIYSAEKIYHLDQNTYGTLGNLVANNYISDPDPGNSNADWNFADGHAPTDTTFNVTATRTGGSYNGNTVWVEQDFAGNNYGGTYPNFLLG